MYTSSVYEACEELFATYQLATINHTETSASMVLLLQHEDEFGFYVLSRDRDEGRPVYSVHPWRQSRIADIDADGSAAIPEVVVNVVTQGVRPARSTGPLAGPDCSLRNRPIEWACQKRPAITRTPAATADTVSHERRLRLGG